MSIADDGFSKNRKVLRREGGMVTIVVLYLWDKSQSESGR